MSITPGKELSRRMAAAESAEAVTAWPYPRPPLDGFQPLVAATLTNYASPSGENYGHLVAAGLPGTSLNPPAATHYAVGLFDFGSVVDLIGYCDRATLGLTSNWLSSNTIPIGGIGGTINAPVTYPLGVFANGFHSILPNGELDTAQLVGHGNVAAVAEPPDSCGDVFDLPVILGNTFTGFFTTVIRVSEPRTATIGGVTHRSPDVRIYNRIDPSVPDPTPPYSTTEFSRSMRMVAAGPSLVTTASYYPDIFDPDMPWFPTLLSAANGTIPFGGGFFATLQVHHGEPGPFNPVQTMRVLVDTGAQSCIMTPGKAADLNLPAEPDFTVEVYGVGGGITEAPGYFVDYAAISALGGGLQFSRVPFIVLNISSPDGDTENFHGVMGTNLFWNRNVVYEPAMQVEGAIRISNPVISFGDLDRDTDVDGDDADLFRACLSGESIPQPDLACLLADGDGDGDVDLTDFGSFQRCLSGENVPSNINCGP